MNHNLRIYLGTAIAVIILTVPLFLLPCDGMLITAYIFSLIGVLGFSGTLHWGINRSGGEYVTTAAFPLAAAGYLFTNILFSFIMILLQTQEKFQMPAGWFFFLHLLLAGLFAWKLLAMDAGKEVIEETGTAVAAETSRWKELVQKLASLVRMAPSDCRKEVSKVYEATRYADPVCNEKLEDLENIIAIKINQLAELLKLGQSADIPALCQELLTDIQIRNEQCKLNK